MASYDRILLSGSTSGKPILVAASSSPGTTIHTAVAGSADIDEIYLWATNTHTAAVTLSIQWGGTTDPNDYICKALSLDPSSEPFPIATGFQLNGGLLVKAFGGSANLITITGYVNRITN